MMKEYYDELGLKETATDEEIAEAYQRLKAKYKEDRWQDGEAGNEAARKLNRLETAYMEITAARKESAQNTQGASSFEEIAELLKADKLSEAQAKLDDFNERNAEWHYLQAVVFYKKNWTNDSKKQLEIAMQMDPENKKYRDAYGKLNARADFNAQQANRGGYQQNPYSSSHGGEGSYDGGEQMGGSACSECLSCCYTYCCINCLYSCCCGCR